jgi:hypothetical protein
MKMKVLFSSIALLTAPQILLSQSFPQVGEYFLISKKDASLGCPPIPGAALGEEVTTNFSECATSGFNPRVDDSGNRIAFISASSELVATGVDDNSTPDVYLYDRAAAVMTRITTGTNPSVPGNGGGVLSNSFGHITADISGNGKVVAFISQAGDLVASPANNGKSQCFYRDLETQTTKMITAYNSPGMLPVTPNFGCLDISVNYDGTKIAFSSDATNLLATSTTSREVYVLDTVTNTIFKVSNPSNTSGSSDGASISSRGDEVVYTTYRRFDIPGLTFYSNIGRSIFNMQSSPITNLPNREIISTFQSASLISVNSSGISGNGNSNQASISNKNTSPGNIARAAFISQATNLDGGATDNRDVFVKSLTNLTGTISRISRGENPLASKDPVISSNGKVVAFVSSFPDYYPDAACAVSPASPASNVYVNTEDSAGQKTYQLISVGYNGNPLNTMITREVDISENGRFVVYAQQGDTKNLPFKPNVKIEDNSIILVDRFAASLDASLTSNTVTVVGKNGAFTNTYTFTVNVPCTGYSAAATIDFSGDFPSRTILPSMPSPTPSIWSCQSINATVRCTTTALKPGVQNFVVSLWNSGTNPQGGTAVLTLTGLPGDLNTSNNVVVW